MSTGYTKLFSSIVHSTIWREPDHVRLVWITMLALSEADGTVFASIPGLADASRVSIDQCKDALARLVAPDEYSRTKDHDGRRIKEVDGGWLILNYLKHRHAAAASNRAEYKREWDAVNRPRRKQLKLARQKPDSARQKPDSARQNPILPRQAEAEAYKRECEARACAESVSPAGQEAKGQGGVAQEAPLPDNWPYADLYRDLKGTGKFDGLNPMALTQLARSFPESKPTDPETIRELVLSATSLSEPIAAPYQWLKARLSAIEVDRTTPKPGAPPVRKEFIDAL